MVMRCQRTTIIFINFYLNNLAMKMHEACPSIFSFFMISHKEQSKNICPHRNVLSSSCNEERKVLHYHKCLIIRVSKCHCTEYDKHKTGFLSCYYVELQHIFRVKLLQL
jgi:hypothetical protein